MWIGPSRCSGDSSTSRANPGRDSVREPERRRHERVDAAGRLRLWLLPKLGFAEGVLVDVSVRGFRFKPSGVVSYRFLRPGRAHHIDVVGRRSHSFTALAEVRHLTDGMIGLETAEDVPVALFRAGPPPHEESPTRR
jgi:hypothetical protein